MPFWKKIMFVVVDIVLAVYLVLAVSSFNIIDEKEMKCNKVSIRIADETTNGFLSVGEIKNILQKKHLYPWRRPIGEIKVRQIEEQLLASPFVNTAQCFLTKEGNVYIDITQRMPVVRIKNERGFDYYLDDKGREMPNSKYVSDLIIATGHISRHYAKNYLDQIAKTINNSELWRNQIMQINILNDYSVELVPRVGDHLINIGRIPDFGNNEERDKKIDEYIMKKLNRLEKFYRYGLSQAGWNKYSYINIEFDNQIICKRKKVN
ncbi:MAG: cell division protein FtsQ [Prevotella sp.]|nr:cell division protein FtsQ [Prevotella sp.]